LYDWFAREYCEIYDWVAFIDIDEFFFFSDGYNLDLLCKEFDSYPAVLLNWKMIGASGHIKRPTCGVVKAYDKPCETVVPIDIEWMYKSFVNLKLFEGFHNLHRAYGSVNTHHSPVYKQLHYDKAWLNHYFTKSWEDWCDRIFKRGGTLRGHRILSDFFICNTDMLDIKYELINSVSDKVPNGTYWIDRDRRLIAGGNIRKIKEINRKGYGKDIY
jgi:hypothetical protein